MNLTESYPLIYDGNGEHRILGLAKSDLLGKAISATDNKRLANYFLEIMGFDKENAALAKA